MHTMYLTCFNTLCKNLMASYKLLSFMWKILFLFGVQHKSGQYAWLYIFICLWRQYLSMHFCWYQMKIIHVDDRLGRNLTVDKCSSECLIWTFICYYLLLARLIIHLDWTSACNYVIWFFCFLFSFNYSVLVICDF